MTTFMPNLLAAAQTSSDGAGFALLPVLIFLPAAGALTVLLIPKTRSELIMPVALGFALFTAALAGWMAVNFETGEVGFQFISRQGWINAIGVQWFVGVDGISLLLVVLSALLFPVAMVAIKPPAAGTPAGGTPPADSATTPPAAAAAADAAAGTPTPGTRDQHRAYFALLLFLEAGCIGAFLALDLFLFFVFFEIVLIPMYFMIGKWGHERAKFAANKFFIYTMAGSAFMLVGILATAFLHSASTGDALTFDVVEIASSGSLSAAAGRWLFAAFALAFAVKVPLFPFHTWLPDAHTEAPTAGSVILAGVLLKLGTYGLIRFGVYLFPEAADFYAPALLTLAVIGILYGAIAAAMQSDLKRLVAYSSVAHLGFIVLGIFSFTTQGLTGGTLQMVNHGLSTGALFLLVGYMYEHYHTRQIDGFGGIQRTAPIFAGVFMLVMLSSVGLPGLNGFVGEFLILLGAFTANRWWAVAGTIGVILAAVYLLWAYQRVFHGPVRGSMTAAAAAPAAPENPSAPESESAAAPASASSSAENPSESAAAPENTAPENTAPASASSSAENPSAAAAAPENPSTLTATATAPISAGFEFRWKQGLAMLPLLAGIITLGVYPRIALDRIEPSVEALIEHIENNVDGFEEPRTLGRAGGGFDDIAHEKPKEGGGHQ